MSAFYRQITIVRSLFPPRKSRLCRKLDVCHRCRAENIMRSKFDDFRFRNSFTAQEKSRKNCVKTLRVKKVRQKLDVSHHCQTLPGERLSHTGLISSDSIQITTLTACITLKIQPFCDIVTFIHVKSIKVTSGFNFRIMKKIRQLALSYRKIKNKY
jgi:hypothetical protein